MKANDAFLKSTYNRYLLPTILAVLGSTINVFIDSLFIGRSMGEDGLAAINLCMPISLILCTLGSLIGAGAAILSAHEIGRNETEESQAIFRQAILLAALCGACLCAFGYAVLTPLTAMLSSDSGLDTLIRSYLSIYFINCLPKLLLFIPFYYLVLDGKNKRCSVVMLLMAALIAVFDALFLLVLDMGIRGAALANVAATTAACALGFGFLHRRDSSFRLSGLRVRLSGITSLIVKNGSPVAMDNLCTALRVALLNIILLDAGGNEYLSAFAVATSIGEFLLCILNGVPETAGAIVGVYSGEQDNAGLRILVRRQFRTGLLIISAASVLILLFDQPLEAMFGVTGGTAALALTCLALSLPIAQINTNMTHYYNHTGRILIANTITVSRVFMLAVGAALALSSFGNLVWLFYPLAEAATLALWVCMAWITARRSEHASGLLLLDTRLETEGSTLDFSVSTGVRDICNASAAILAFCDENGLSHRQAMTLSLAVEEVLMITADKCFAGREDGSIDVRFFHLENSTGIRFRYGGRQFNTVEFARREDDGLGETLGIKMILRMAKQVIYRSTFGVNNVVILL